MNAIKQDDPPRSLSPAMSKNVEDMYRMVRERIMHEDELINHRITWFVNSQGFLVLALGIVFSSQSGDAHSYIADKYSYIVGLSFIGLAASVAAFLGVMSASSAIDDVVTWWREFKKSNEISPQAAPRIIGFSNRREDRRF